MARLRGRAKRGMRCRSPVPHGHWKTTTFTGALRLTALAGLTFSQIADEYVEHYLRRKGTRSWKDIKGSLNHPYLHHLTEWRLHDIRRTVRSKLAELGVPREVARKIVNHEEGKVDRIYNRHEYMAEKREALEKWERHLAELISRQRK